MANIGDLVVNLDANTQGLERGIDRATQATGRYRDAAGRMREANGKFVSSASAAGGAIDNTARSATNAGAAFSNFGQRIKQVGGLLASIGIGIGISQAVRQVADFQTALNGLAATSNATAEQMGALESQARELGATSRFSAQQAAEGQRFLAQAGFSVNEVMGATPGILQLATAAQLDLGQAADIASNVLGGMRLEVEELNRVNDVLAATASRSNTNIQQLGQALSFAAPFAAGAGISIEEAAAAIGTMSDAGIQASRAGTGLVGTIRQLSKVTDEGEKVLDKYSLSVSDVNIEARGLGPVLETLRAANLSTADAIALFGSEAGAAAQVLVNDYSGGIEGAEGEAARMAEQLNRGLTPAFRSLGSAVSESVLQMGDSGMAGALEGLIRSATGVISVWNGMGDEWAEANGVGEDHLATIRATATAIEALTGIVVGAGGAVAAMAALTRGTAAARGAMVALNVAVRANPIGAFVTVVGAAAGVLFTFREELGLVSSPAEGARREIELLTGAIEDMNDSSVQAAMISINGQLFDLERRAREARKELEDSPGRSGGSGVLGFSEGEIGPRALAEGALGDIGVQRQALLDRQRDLLALTEGVGQLSSVISDEAIEAAVQLADSTRKASDALDEFSARLTPEVEDILERAGPGATIDAEGQIRDAWGNTLPTLQRQLEDELQGQVNAFSAEQNLMKGLEEAAKRFTDEAETAAKQAFGSIQPSSQNAVREAMNEAKNIGSLTFKLESADGTSETDVEGDADDLRRLANLFSGVASAV